MTWTAIDLSQCGTEFLRDMLSRRNGPAAARAAILQELNHRNETER